MCYACASMQAMTMQAMTMQAMSAPCANAGSVYIEDLQRLCKHDIASMINASMIMQAMCTPIAVMYPCWICTLPATKTDSPPLQS